MMKAGYEEDPCMQVLTTTPSLRSPQAGYEEDLGRNCAVMSAPSLFPSPAAAAATAATASGASPAGLSHGWRVAGVRAGQWFDAPGLRCVTPETLR